MRAWMSSSWGAGSSASPARSSVEMLRGNVLSLENLPARRTVLCAGSWSGQLAPLDVFPVRGELILLDAAPPECVVFGGGGYLVPRDGHTLVGATSEPSAEA